MTARKKYARHVEFSQALFDRICARISEGGAIREICAGADMPDRTTFNRWRKKTPELQAQYDAACIDREEVYFEQIIAIADDSAGDTVDVGNGIKALNPESVQRSKVRIDARKWVLACMNRKKYGDRVTNEHTGEDGGPVQVVQTVNLVAMKRDES